MRDQSADFLEISKATLSLLLLFEHYVENLDWLTLLHQRIKLAKEHSKVDRQSFEFNLLAIFVCFVNHDLLDLNVFLLVVDVLHDKSPLVLRVSDYPFIHGVIDASLRDLRRHDLRFPTDDLNFRIDSNRVRRSRLIVTWHVANVAHSKRVCLFSCFKINYNVKILTCSSYLSKILSSRGFGVLGFWGFVY